MRRAAVQAMVGFTCFAAASTAAATTSINGHVPRGWVIERSIVGDLVGDSRPYTVLVIRRTSSRLLRNDRFYGIMDYNPRRLLILERAPTGLSQFAVSQSLVQPRTSRVEPCEQDPMTNVRYRIRQRVLSIELRSGYNCQFYWDELKTFRFREERERLRLIGYDVWSMYRLNSRIYEHSLNFLTGWWRERQGLQEVTDRWSFDRWRRYPRGRYFLEDIDSNCPTAQARYPWCGVRAS
jgi:hypothetical protein